MSRGATHSSTVADLEREKRLVETLYRVAQAVAEHDDLHAIVQAVTDEATAATGAAFGAFFYNVVSRDGESYDLYTISGVPASHFERFPMPRNSDVFRPTFEGQGTVRLDDVTRDERYGRNPPYYGMPEGHLPVKSYLAVPVRDPGGGVVGGLFFGHEQPAMFTEEHERVAEGIATHAGIAIEKARLLAAERDARAEAEARSYAAAALELVEDGVVMVDAHGFVRLWNRAAERITGLPAATVLGRPIGRAISGWERIALDVPVGAPTGTVAPATLPVDTVARAELWVSIYGVGYEDGTVYAFRDVTEQRGLDELRADVVATVSHELRTPIAAVYGAAQTLRGRALDAATNERLLEVIGTESERLAGLVGEILLTSQIDAGQVRVRRDHVDPRVTVDAAVRSVADAETAATIEIDADVDVVAADRERLQQVLTNLVENALKYGRTPTSPTIGVRVRNVRDSVRFEVSDQGPGVPAAESERIFEKFHRLDPHMQRGVRGTGLGLYICRELVHRMHGSIGVDSSEAGSTFWVELPRY